MKFFSLKFSLASIQRVVLSLLLVVCAVACTNDVPTPDNNDKTDYEVEKYAVPTADAMSVVSQLPAYIIPYGYTNFGQALVNRLQNKVELTDIEALLDLSTVVLHSSQIETLSEDDWVVILVQLLIGRNIIIIEPTI